MSAAVIGRQLRQQQTTGRTSGPLVPPQPSYKNRPRTPSHIPQRPYSPAPASLTGTGTSGQTAYHHYPSPHTGPHGEKDKKKEEEPRIKCTWHCFCVALKALSGGIVLLVAGTVMSVVGFVAEANHVYTRKINGTDVHVDVDEHVRNLTFAGPVIMGLGGIVIVAALVLTFEVRDTLGVKVAPVKPETTQNSLIPPTTTITTSSANTSRKNTVASLASQKPQGGPTKLNSGIGGGDGKSEREASEAEDGAGTGKHKATHGSLTLPLAVLSDLSHSSALGFNKERLQDTIHETVFTEAGSGNGVPGALSSDGSGRNRGNQQVSISRRRYAADHCHSPSSGTTLSHLLSPNIETLYFGLPSPQDTELSDPEGCSLTVPTRWRSARCSCSGSPTHSMSMELYLEDNDPPISIKIIEQQRLQQQLIIQQQLLLQQQQQQLKLQQRLLQQQQQQRQQPRKVSKVIASIESDGLSTSSSSDDIFVPQRKQKLGQTCHSRDCVVNVHNSSDQVDLTTPLLANEKTVDPSKSRTSCCSSSTVATISSTSSTIPTSLPLLAQSSVASNVNCTSDKRFPLLRQGALGNGAVSVPASKS